MARRYRGSLVGATMTLSVRTTLDYSGILDLGDGRGSCQGMLRVSITADLDLVEFLGNEVLLINVQCQEIAGVYN